ncbi:MAG: hypothetical protein KGP14_01805 [Betaproteobacteria bacterium]|nr:hypothetical protein [Betaproteobacteria bacterium]
MKTPFLGSAYSSRSTNLAGQRCINLYPELIETKEGKEVGGFYGVPGLDLLTTLGNGPIRGEHTMQGGNLYVVSGSGLYAVTAGWAGALLGTLQTASGPVSIIDNGSQVAVFDGVAGYCWNGTSFVTLSLPFTGPMVANYQDGFGIVNALGTGYWYQSNYKDLITWQALNFGTADGKPDPIVGLGDIHREVWLFGTSSTEVWINAGNSGFAFQRLTGVFIETGCAAPWSICKMGEGLVWLGQSDGGQGVVYLSKGYQPQRISTHAIEAALKGYATIADAIGYSYQDAGHTFYVLTFPTANVTWCYDATTGLWHQRAGFSAGQFTRHAGNAYAFFNGLHVIGDYASGNLYSFNLENYTDNGLPRKWVRSWRALPSGKAVDKPIRFDSLRLDLETGITVPAGTNPQIVLRWSDDGGHKWSNEHLAAWGTTGATAQRVKWNRLGSTRRNSGLDRIFEVSSSDPVRAALIGAEMEAS